MHLRLPENQFKIWVWLVNYFILGLFLTGCQLVETQTPADLSSPIAPIHTPSSTEAPLWTLPSMTDELDQQVANLLLLMPEKGSEDFSGPADRDMIAFSQLVNEIRIGDIQQAAMHAAELNYQLIEFNDRGDENASSYLLREEEPIKKGWGLYVIRKDNPTNVIIEVPHPLFDRGTQVVGLEIFQSLNASALLIAGSHRNANNDQSADVAHNPLTIFQAVHETLIESGDYVVVQIHGFSSAKHPGYPQVVIGSNQLAGARMSPELADVFTNYGILTGVCNGTLWRELCGQTNTQLVSTPADTFIHLELNEYIREKYHEINPNIEQVLINGER